MDLLDIDERISEGLKQNRIDAYISKEIHSVTQKYDKLLVNVLKRGETIISDPSDEMDNTNFLCSCLGKLVREVLIDLWKDPTPTNYALKCVQKISYMPRHLQISNEKYEGYSWNESGLFKELFQALSHSRLLMGTEGSKLIMKLIDQDFPTKNYKLQVIRKNRSADAINEQKLLYEISSSEGKKPIFSTDRYEFKYSLEETEPYTITLLNKTSGVQFGGVFEVIFPSQYSKRYFCKAYWGYPGKGNFNSQKAFTISMQIFGSDDILNDKTVKRFYEPLDFKELFIYKALEYLEVGPHAHFFKVPVLKDGFFIMTEDLSTPNGKFTEIGKMYHVLEIFLIFELKKLQQGRMDQSIYGTFQALRGLLELDTINRIFKLRDSHDRNFGYIDADPSSSRLIDETTAQEWLKQEHEFKIVDFIAPSRDDPYEVEDIFNTFLSGNTVTNYLSGHLMDIAIRRHFDGDIEDKELTRKHKAEKVFFGKQVIKSLEQRCSKFGDLKSLLLQAKTDVEDFLRKEKCEEISDEYLREEFTDIDRYIEGIIKNYSVLKEAIESSAD